jgi:hypothetical protein
MLVPGNHLNDFDRLGIEPTPQAKWFKLNCAQRGL